MDSYIFLGAALHFLMMFGLCGVEYRNSPSAENRSQEYLRAAYATTSVECKLFLVPSTLTYRPIPHAVDHRPWAFAEKKECIFHDFHTSQDI